jgi:hypothetical protein
MCLSQSIADHCADNSRTLGLRLDAADRAQIKAAIIDKTVDLPGDCGDEYR